MVLDFLMTAVRAEKKPRDVFLLGFFFATIAIFLGLWIFPEHASLLMVFLTSFAAMPLMRRIICEEWNKDESMKDEKTLLKEHAKALKSFLYLF